ncbi:hypothetical protein BDR06DRAFT_1007810 [Suillus hirtellus]|nr:hypothetical protein BDR06DRAFT_1007810 [Suillus hirtellus]
MAVLRAKLNPTLMLRKWIKEVRHLDEKYLEDIAMHRRIAEDLYKSARHTNQTQTTRTFQLNASSSTSTTHLGPLTLTECTLLANHNGCFKYQRFYVSHRSKDCPNGAPEASAYKTITEVDAIAAKSKSEKPKQVVAITPVTVTITPSFSPSIHPAGPCMLSFISIALLFLTLHRIPHGLCMYIFSSFLFSLIPTQLLDYLMPTMRTPLSLTSFFVLFPTSLGLVCVRLAIYLNLSYLCTFLLNLNLLSSPRYLLRTKGSYLI